MNKKVIGLGALTALGVVALFTEGLYRYVFCRKKPPIFKLLFDSSKGHREPYYKLRDESAQRLREREHVEWTIHSKRGEALKGYYYPCGAGGKKIAFVVHGYRSDHADTAGMYYDYYRSRGIDLFCCDHTAHGASEGTHIGFDVFESKDCLDWVDFLVEKFGPDTQILLHGFSMGAATVMQMSSHCPPQVKFIIEDSGYRNARASLDHQVGPMYQPLRLINKLVAGYDIDDSDVTASLSASRVPMLFVHGTEDKLVPACNGPALYEMYQGEKDCFFPCCTRHIETMYTSPEGYGRKIDSFIEKYFK